MRKIKMVRREGGSRIMAVSDVIPKSWEAVETEVTKESKTAITIIIKKVR